MLEVPDASTWAKFRKNAKQIYDERHPGGAKRGPQSRMKEIFTVLYRADEEGLIGKKNLSQGKLVGILQDHFGGTEKEKQNRKRGLYTYAKLWLLLNRKAPNTRTIQEKEWISNQFPRAKKLQAKLHEFFLDPNEWKFIGGEGFRKMSRKQLEQVKRFYEETEKEIEQIDPPQWFKGKSPNIGLIFEFQSLLLDKLKTRKQPHSS